MQILAGLAASAAMVTSLVGCSGIIPSGGQPQARASTPASTPTSTPASAKPVTARSARNTAKQAKQAKQDSEWVEGLPGTLPSQDRPVPSPDRSAENSAPPPIASMNSAFAPALLVSGGAPIRPLAGGSEIAAAQQVREGPDLSRLPLAADDAAGALAAFRTSCPSLLNRDDRSGLTRKGDWSAACAAAKEFGQGSPTAFFARYFETLQVGDGKAFATGYFEPEIAGRRSRGSGYDIPVYRRPDDLVEVDLGQFSEDWKGKRVRGRVQDGRLVRYADRAAIEDGALKGRGLELAFAADPIEFFFLQIQGSGRLIGPDGSVIRIGYDGQNGHDYLGIGRVLLDEGRLEPGEAGLEGIIRWLRTNPKEGRELMRRNGSYIFFRELTGDGPLGAMGWPVTGENTVAVDPRYVPMGAPVILAMDRAEPNGLWVAQDTGGAIKGPNRFDTFWGAGSRARQIAGGMAARGQAVILVPKGTFNRLKAEAQSAARGQ